MAGLDVPLLIFGNIDDNKPTVIINARIHPGESNSSWVMQGIIEFFTNVSNKIGLKILNSINLILVPMLNPDGVVAGNYRTSISGKDLNRQLIDPDVTLYPEVFHLKQFLKNKVSNLIAFFDLHGH